jgi:hypothetical protein
VFLSLSSKNMFVSKESSSSMTSSPVFNVGISRKFHGERKGNSEVRKHAWFICIIHFKGVDCCLHKMNIIRESKEGIQHSLYWYHKALNRRLHALLALDRVQLNNQSMWSCGKTWARLGHAVNWIYTGARLAAIMLTIWSNSTVLTEQRVWQPTFVW